MRSPLPRRRLLQSRRGKLSVTGAAVVFCLGLALGPDLVTCTGETGPEGCLGGTIDWRVAGSALAGLIAGLASHRLLPAALDRQDYR